MLNIKILLAGLVFSLVLLALAASDARVAGEFMGLSNENDATLPVVEELGAGGTSSSEATVSEEQENGDVAQSVDVDSSTSIDIDFHSSTDVSVDGAGEATVEGAGSGFVVNGEEISCPEGERTKQEDDDTKVTCWNRNGRIDIDFDQDSDDGGSVDFDINLDIN